MSNEPSEPEHDLAQILGRINALSKLHHPVTPEGASNEALDTNTIPVLINVYEGESAPVASLNRSVQHAPPSYAANSEAHAAALAEKMAQLKSDDIEHLILEMLPLIRAELKKALHREQAGLEQALLATLERDLVDALRTRLLAGQL